MKLGSHPIPVILAISCEISQTLANFSLKISTNRENHHSGISRFMRTVKQEITLTFDSLKFSSITILKSVELISQKICGAGFFFKFHTVEKGKHIVKPTNFCCLANKVWRVLKTSSTSHLLVFLVNNL